jgi:Holliday junction resolvasome RuvABC endonuclease subunit
MERRFSSGGFAPLGIELVYKQKYGRYPEGDEMRDEIARQKKTGEWQGTIEPDWEEKYLAENALLRKLQGLGTTSCGIDPGFSGALAVVSAEGKVLALEDMPVIKVGSRRELNEPAIKDFLKQHQIAAVALEKSQTMPGQGVASSGRYMMSYGVLRGLCVGLGIPYQLVHPRTWKSAMMPDMPKEKEASIQRVGQLYPDLVLNRKKDHGKADALLICLYGQKSTAT